MPSFMRCTAPREEEAKREEERGFEEAVSPGLEEVAPLRVSQRGFWRVFKGDSGPAEPHGGWGDKNFFEKFFNGFQIKIASTGLSFGSSQSS